MEIGFVHDLDKSGRVRVSATAAGWIGGDGILRKGGSRDGQ